MADTPSMFSPPGMGAAPAPSESEPDTDVMSPFGPEVQSHVSQGARSRCETPPTRTQLEVLQQDVRQLTAAVHRCIELQVAQMGGATMPYTPKFGGMPVPAPSVHLSFRRNASARGSTNSLGPTSKVFKFNDALPRREQKAAAELHRRETCGAKLKHLVARASMVNLVTQQLQLQPQPPQHLRMGDGLPDIAMLSPRGTSQKNSPFPSTMPADLRDDCDPMLGGGSAPTTSIPKISAHKSKIRNGVRKLNGKRVGIYASPSGAQPSKGDFHDDLASSQASHSISVTSSLMDDAQPLSPAGDLAPAPQDAKTSCYIPASIRQDNNNSTSDIAQMVREAEAADRQAQSRGSTPRASPEVKSMLKRHPSLAGVPRRESAVADNPIFQAVNENAHDVACTERPAMLPDDPRKVVLDMAVLLVVVYASCSSLFHMATRVTPSLNHRVVNFMSVPVIGAWIFSNFKTAYLEGWALIESLAVIRRTYLRTWLLFDFVMAVPWELFSLIGAGDVFCKAALTFRILCVVTIYRLFGLSNPVDERPLWQRFIFAAVFIVVMLNCAASSWMLVATGEEQGFWNDEDAASDHRRQYIAAMYWTFATMTSVGYGDISGHSVPARMLSMLWMSIGVFSVIILGAKCTQWMVVADPFVLAELEKKRRFRAFMRHNEVPWNIQKSALEVYPVVLETGSTAYNNIIEELPQILQEKIQQHVKLRLIRKVPIFEGVSRACLNAVAEVTVLEEYALAANIIECGEIGREMFFLDHGIVEVYTYNRFGQDTWITNLKGGSFFGEVALLSEDCRRTATVRAVTCCTVFTLAKECFDEVALLYPDLRSKVQAASASRMVVTHRASVFDDFHKAVKLVLLLHPRTKDSAARLRWKRAVRWALGMRCMSALGGLRSPSAKSMGDLFPFGEATTPAVGTFREPSGMLMPSLRESDTHSTSSRGDGPYPRVVRNPLYDRTIRVNSRNRDGHSSSDDDGPLRLTTSPAQLRGQVAESATSLNGVFMGM